MPALAIVAMLAGATSVERYALIIGYNGTARDGVQPLHYADDDALAMAQLLGDAAVSTIVLTRADADTERAHGGATTQGAPTVAELRDAVHRTFTAMRDAAASGRSSELIVFYSGHGQVDNGEGYLFLEDGRLTRAMLFDEILEPSPALVNHVIIDACKSSYLTFDKGVGGTRRNFAWSMQNGDRAVTMARTGFVLSTASGRDSHEWERFQAGVFTHDMDKAFYAFEHLEVIRTAHLVAL